MLRYEFTVAGGNAVVQANVVRLADSSGETYTGRIHDVARNSRIEGIFYGARLQSNRVVRLSVARRRRHFEVEEGLPLRYARRRNFEDDRGDTGASTAVTANRRFQYVRPS